jgi:hypothetical protein
MTLATHVQTKDDQHAVLLSDLHVMVEHNGATWFAQGVEIDYAASGASLEDVQDRFERGLRRTIEANLKRFNSIERLLKYAPAEVREQFHASAIRFELTHRSVFDLSNNIPSSFPFHRLVFAERIPAPC